MKGGMFDNGPIPPEALEDAGGGPGLNNGPVVSSDFANMPFVEIGPGAISIPGGVDEAGSGRYYPAHIEAKAAAFREDMIERITRKEKAMTTEQMPDLDAVIARIKAATPEAAPWTAADFSDSQDDGPEIDAAIATILNAVAAGALVRADICRASGQVRALDDVDVQGWSAFKGHALPTAIARHIAERANAALAPQPAVTCRKCGGAMQAGKAMGQTFTSGVPDDLGGDAQTMSAGGPGALIECSKCADCGWSVTAPQWTMNEMAIALEVGKYRAEYQQMTGLAYPEIVCSQPAGEAVPVDLRQRIYALLLDYRQDEVRDEDGCGYPLVDALTITGHGIDMGEREIKNIADMLARELARPPQPSETVVEALHNLIVCAEPYMSDEAQMLALAEARAALRALKGEGHAS